MNEIICKLKILWIIFICDYDYWKKEIWDKSIDDPYCCSGRECGCGGMTIKDLYLNSDNDRGK